MKTDNKTQQKKKKRGRPKDSKNSLPFTTFPDAITYSKNIWDEAQYREISFKEISDSMKLHAKKAVRVLSALKEFYGIVERTDSNNWRLTDAGKRLAKNEQNALQEVFTKSPLFAELYSAFGSKQVTEGVITEHIRKKYKYVDVEEVKRRLLEGIAIINKNPSQNQTPSDVSTKQDFAMHFFQLRYAIKPATNDEITVLVDKVIELLEKSGDETLKLISELMNEKKDDQQELFNLLSKAMKRLNIDFANIDKSTKQNQA